MQVFSIGGVPGHKLQERAELEALVAAFEGRQSVVVAAPTAAPGRADSADPAPDPHLALSGDERSIVNGLRAIRREAVRLSAHVAALSQAGFE